MFNAQENLDARAVKANHLEGYCITRDSVHTTREMGRSSAKSRYVRRERERERELVGYGMQN